PSPPRRPFPLIGGRFLGRSVVLLQEGEHAEALPPGPPRAVLYRPLQIAELWVAVTGVQPVAAPALELAEEAEAEGAVPPGRRPEAAEAEAQAPEAAEGAAAGAEAEGPGSGTQDHEAA